MSMRTKPVALIVDDESPVRSLVRKILEAGHWSVLEARDGGEALEMLTTNPGVDLLVTDLQMPVMTGNELATAVRLVRSGVKVLYVTGYSEMLFASVPVLNDGEAFLDKPFTPRGLDEAVSLLFFGTVQPLNDTFQPGSPRLLPRVRPAQVRQLPVTLDREVTDWAGPDGSRVDHGNAVGASA